MSSDAVLIALINESVNAEHQHRRWAAKILIEILRNNRELATTVSEVEIVPAEDAGGVADKIGALIAKYQLGGVA